MLPHRPRLCQQPTPVASFAPTLYNTRAPFGDFIGREVSAVNARRFIEAVGASIAGYYVCKAIDFVVTLLFN